MISRPMYLESWRELADGKAMVFMSGPRQAGKTTLAQTIAESFVNNVYLNWDVLTDRARLTRHPYFFESLDRHDESAPLVVFDEIHKYKEWKNYLKGVYDRFHREYRFLITGSGRLDMYRRGGDSLAGRYSLFRLWPFSLAELAAENVSLDSFLADPLALATGRSGRAEETWRRLACFTGFPEPYISAKMARYRRWSATYHSQLIREDIRDLTGIKSIGDLVTLFSLLPDRVGSLLSISSLSEDLRVSYNTVKAWLEVLERFYLVFSISPFARKIARATQKARKLYLFDYATIEDEAAKFENMVAFELLRATSMWNDMGHGRFGLHFVRNKEQQEVDFLLTEKRRPILLVEAKRNETQIESSLRKFQDQLGVPAVQLTDQGNTYRRITNGERTILVAPAYRWLQRLP